MVALAITSAVVIVIGVLILGKLTGEDWCADRSPWWGPPEDPNSTCSGHSWERDHPGEFPWTLPR